MEIVVGLSLRNLKPRVWDPASTYYLKAVRAIMVSYAEFDHFRARRQKAMEQGLRAYLGAPDGVKVYLDNGSFSFHRKGTDVPQDEYGAFVEAACPDWYPTPQDYIPAPSMVDDEQRACLEQTMAVNLSYVRDGFVPVMHVCRLLDEYLQHFQGNEQLRDKPRIAIGGIVPNLLRARRAMSYTEVLDNLGQVRASFSDKHLHLFGLGGTATLHLAALLGIDSVDSSGWRNRAARGIVQLPGRGDRMVADLGSWRGREPDEGELQVLMDCMCPACQQHGLDGLKADKLAGFCNRATHNLWVLLDEARQIEEHIQSGTYREWYTGHVENSVYKPLIDYAIQIRHLSDSRS